MSPLPTAILYKYLLVQNYDATFEPVFETNV